MDFLAFISIPFCFRQTRHIRSYKQRFKNCEDDWDGGN